MLSFPDVMDHAPAAVPRIVVDIRRANRARIRREGRLVVEFDMSVSRMRMGTDHGSDPTGLDTPSGLFGYWTQN
jgi:hypothetical protein